MEYGTLISRLVGLPRPAIVGVEGFTSSGKSHLADALAKNLAGVVVHTDKYVTDGQVALPYPDRLDYRGILSALNDATSRTSLTIVEGICLRETLSRASISANLFVYLKFLAQNGLWHDGLSLEDFENRSSPLDEPHFSDFTYHVKQRPHECADIVFERIENFGEA